MGRMAVITRRDPAIPAAARMVSRRLVPQVERHRQAEPATCRCSWTGRALRATPADTPGPPQPAPLSAVAGIDSERDAQRRLESSHLAEASPGIRSSAVTH